MTTIDADLESFCRRMLPKLVGSMVLLGRDRASADDIAQETLIRVVQRWSRVRTMEAPDAYTYKIAMRLSHRRWRRDGRRRELEVHLVDDTVEPDLAAIVAVRDAVARLPQRERETLVCRYFLDLSVRETAHVLRCAEGTVKAATAHAIERLRANDFVIDTGDDSHDLGLEPADG